MPKEESDMVGDMQYSWRKLKKQAVDVAENLATLQVSPWYAAVPSDCAILEV